VVAEQRGYLDMILSLTPKQVAALPIHERTMIHDLQRLPLHLDSSEKAGADKT
jgi:hypothetical protein